MVRKGILAQSIFFSAAAVLVISTIALILFVGGNGLTVFRFENPTEFFFTPTWDQNSQTFGVLPLLYGSVMTVLITLIISAPLVIAVSVFMVEIAPNPVRRIMRTTVELFASLPSVIYGLLGLTLIIRWAREVKDKLQQSALSLSGGQQQRLCIARAVATRPSVLLMDEPAAALDPVSTLKIEELMAELEKDFTIIIVTHNLQQAGRVADYTVFMSINPDTRADFIVESGPTEQLFTKPKDPRTEAYISGRFG